MKVFTGASHSSSKYAVLPDVETNLTLGKVKITEPVQTQQAVMTEVLSEFPTAKDYPQLLTKMKKDDPRRQAVIQIANSGTSSMKFKIAREMATNNTKDFSVLDYVRDLPSHLEGYHTPEESAQIIHAWCEAQGIEPIVWFTVWRDLMNEKFNKIKGIALTGASNSGKSMMTKLMFSCIEEFVGEVSNQDNFPFENLVGKKIALAEETAITSANVDNYKTLLCGGTAYVNIKHQAQQPVSIGFFMLNSNVKVLSNLNMTVNKEAIRNRIIAFEDLKETQILNKFCEKKIHPLAYCIIDQKQLMNEFTGDVDKFKQQCKRMRETADNEQDLEITIQGHVISFSGDFLDLLAHDDQDEVIQNNLPQSKHKKPQPKPRKYLPQPIVQRPNDVLRETPLSKKPQASDRKPRRGYFTTISSEPKIDESDEADEYIKTIEVSDDELESYVTPVKKQKLRRRLFCSEDEESDKENVDPLQRIEEPDEA